MIRMLQDLIGLDPVKDIPLDCREVMSLFQDTSALGITPEDIGGCKLGALGVPCGIATASEAFQARDAMVRLGLWKHFLFAFSSLQYGPKTGPDLYRAAARSLGSAPERTVVFEDALHAARSAKRAGFLVAGVYDPSAEEDQEALRCLCDWYLPRLDSPDFLAALERG